MEHNNLDVIWLINATGIVLLMQAGFCCLESGLVRKKNTLNVAIKNFVDFSLCSLIFWMFGFALMFGETQGIWARDELFFFSGQDSWGQAFFLFQMVFCGTAVTIISGAVAERIRFSAYLIICLMVSALIYPTFGHWAWGGLEAQKQTGWLAQIGFVDFAGSTIVHSVGGWVALATILIIGPRVGRFNEDKSPNEIQPSNLPLSIIGAFLLWIGWFGFNGGSTLAWTDKIPGILVNTVLAGIAGSLSVMLISWKTSSKPRVDSIFNGALAGLVSVTANCNSTDALDALIIGMVGGTISIYLARLLERFRIDDTVNSVPVHCGPGVWGTLAVALFGNPETWGNGHTRLEQLGVQALGVGIAFVWAFGLSFILLKLVNRIFPLRVTAREERIGLDVSEHSREHLEAKIQKDETLIAAMLDNVGDGILTVDPQGKIESFNPAAQSILGYPGEETSNLPITNVFQLPHDQAQDSMGSSSTDDPPFLELFRHYKNKELELEGIKKDGSRVPLGIRISEMNLDGHIFFTCIFQDITERQLARAQMEENKAYLENLVDQRTRDLVLANDELKDKSGMIQLHKDIAVWVNEDNPIEKAMEISIRTICEYTEWPVGHYYALASEPWKGLVPSNIWYQKDPARFEEFRLVTEQTPLPPGVGLPGRVLQQGEPAWIMDVLQDSNFPRARDGRDIGVRAGFAFPVLNRNRVMGVLEFFSPELIEPNEKLLDTMRSIGALLGRVLERWESDEKLLEAKQEAESANTAKSEFLSRMTHELRTPLNAILGYAQILERREHLENPIREPIANIHKAGKHLLSLINDILDISKIEAGAMELKPVNFDLCFLGEEAQTLFKERCEDKALSLNIEMPERNPIWVQVDEVKIRQIMINLLGNALRFTDTGGLTFRILDEGCDRYRFEFSDTGPGIAKDIQAKIFEPFTQDKASLAKGGTGLGLAIVKQLLELMGSELQLDSNIGQGTRFTFSLLLPPSDKPGQRSLPSKKVKHLAEGFHVNALVVDDNKMNREVLSELLQSIGVRVFTAVDGKDGIEKIRKNQPDIVFMDMRMPVMAGDEAIRIIHNEFPDNQIKIAVITASVFEHQREFIDQLQIDGFVPKPFQDQEVFKCIADNLNVDFVYEETDASNVLGEPKQNSGFPLMNIELPDGMYNSIIYAAELGNLTDLEEALETLDSSEIEGHRLLSKHLRQSLATFNMGEIMDTLKTMSAS